MLTVELKDTTGHRVAEMAIYPMDLPDQMIGEQYRLAQYLSQIDPLRYYFLVSRDRIFCWKIGEPQPRFVLPAREVLGRYAGSTEALEGIGSEYLSKLVEAWVADLTTHWKSRDGVVPGEEEMRQLGILGDMTKH